MPATMYTESEKIRIITDMINSHIPYKEWCKQKGISYNTVGYWKRNFEKKGIKYWGTKKYYKESDYDSCFDVDPTQVMIYGTGKVLTLQKKRTIFMYPGTEKYRWIIFSDYRVRSVVETACDLGIDVWYWDMIENCWKRLFKCYDNDAQIIEENREEFKKFGINWKANYHWTYLKEYLIPWSEEDIQRMCDL